MYAVKYDGIYSSVERVFPDNPDDLPDNYGKPYDTFGAAKDELMLFFQDHVNQYRFALRETRKITKREVDQGAI